MGAGFAPRIRSMADGAGIRRAACCRTNPPMADDDTLRDVTGTVALDDAGAVADAVDRILARSFGSAPFHRDLLHASFAFAGRLYRGDEPGWLPCDMPYHDLRHALDAALAMARLVDGCRRDGCDRALGPDTALAAVLLALLHDTGFLRTTAEASLCGPQLAQGHEYRSAAFAGDYLRSTSLARYAELAPLIMATRMSIAPAAALEGRDGAAITIGRMLGSADLLCQLADPRYLERCYHHLYPEMLLGAVDASRGADAPRRFVVEDAREMLARTPGFLKDVALPRLREGFGFVARHLAAHFDGGDPYAASTRGNLARCERIVAERRFDLLGGPPPTTTRDLDPIYAAGEAARATDSR